MKRCVVWCVLAFPACFDPGDGGAEGSTSSADDGTSMSGGASTTLTTGVSATQTTGLDSTSDATDTGGAVCGNGVIDSGEECDLGVSNSDNAGCTSQCVLAVCGDGLLQIGREDCDDAGESAACDADCTDAQCGDGTINATAGEGCEADGPQMTCTSCEVVCDAGFDNCNDDPGDGCEADLTTLATCADCDTSCDPGTQLCMDQMCWTTEFLVNERNASTIHRWTPSDGATVVFHQTTANDADCNPAQGSTFGWAVDHFTDMLARYVPGSAMGVDLTVGVPYAYPKHVAVYGGEIVVMGRNNATLHRYTDDAVLIADVASGNSVGQGLATDGTDLFASFWSAATTVSSFVRYDATFTAAETFVNPTGMGANNNLFDLAHDPVTGNFFGLATVGEGGTVVETTTVFEFPMGGAVANTYTLPFLADGIGQSFCPP